MRLHPRHDQTVKAEIEIQGAVLAAVKTYDLTYGEFTMALAQCMASWAKYQVKDERAPEEPEPSDTQGRDDYIPIRQRVIRETRF